jgi:hypothetical protein
LEVEGFESSCRWHQEKVPEKLKNTLQLTANIVKEYPDETLQSSERSGGRYLMGDNLKVVWAKFST